MFCPIANYDSSCTLKHGPFKSADLTENLMARICSVDSMAWKTLLLTVCKCCDRCIDCKLPMASTYTTEGDRTVS